MDGESGAVRDRADQRVCRLDELEKQFKVNFFGHMSVTQAILPIMKKQKSGQVYMMSSVAAMAGMSPFAAYNSSKAALEGAYMV